MGKTAFLFPGQGAQYIGMGKDFYEQIPVSRRMFEIASEATGLDLPALCFEENDKIHITEYTQIALLTASAAMLEALKEKGVKSDVNAGLSLGEYGALVASGAIDYEDACRLVRKRGIYMQEEVPAGEGAMSAVLGMEASAIEEILEKEGKAVEIANYNCPGQIVISGETKAVGEVGEVIKAAGAKRVVPLKVSGPFHSSLLKGAGEKLSKELENVTLHDFTVPYVTNVTAEYVTDTRNIKDLLIRQVSSSVRWQQSVELMLKDGVDTFIEIGPGKTLTSFVKKIDRSAAVYNIQMAEDMNALLEALK